MGHGRTRCDCGHEEKCLCVVWHGRKSGVCKQTKHTTKDGKIVWKGCEVDHRVSREVGGADTIENLWPQPYLAPE